MKTLKNYLDERSKEVMESNYIDWAVSFCQEFGYITTDDITRHYGIDNLSEFDIKNIRLLPFFYRGLNDYEPVVRKKTDGSKEEYYTIVLEEGYYSVHKVTREDGVSYFFTATIKEYAKKDSKIMKLGTKN